MIKLAILYEQLIKEVGDLENIATFPYSNNAFITDQDWKVDVSFQEFSNEDLQAFKINTKFYPAPVYNVIFEVEGVESQYTKTTVAEYLKILKTVVAICYDFLKEKDPNGLTFFAANKDESKFLTSDPQKSKMYKIIVAKQLLKSNKYKMVDLKLYSGIEGFMIYKK